MNRKENYLAALNHRPTEWVPFSRDSVSWGYDDLWFEKGPKSGGLDGFGVRWVRPSSGMNAGIPAPGEFVLKDVTQWKKVVQFPDVDAFDWEKASEEFYSRGIDREQVAVDFGCGNGQYERLGALMGFEEALVAMFEEPEATFDLLNAITDYKIKVVEKAAQYFKPDSFTSFDDTCTQRSTFMSPEVYRELIAPVHKRLNDACIEHGILPIQHCCGKGEEIIESFIEEHAVAWTIVQPCNDIAGLLDQYGDKITIIGGFDSNGPAGITMEEELIREDVRRCMKEYGPHRGYIFGGFLMPDSANMYKMPELLRIMEDEYRKCL